ncbi:response regulator [Rheinheimera sp. UJ51]|uniref:response regulator n=1 Tax=unclassified Rheinheimera TaxID=115860 RepID=UPI001E451EBF|nr:MULTISPECIES: response regulator [unclassified Rheinheimera]MCC5452426.1 response regulator [Rheinheimera sp. UJ51]MCF4010247.1 response regulator [Rheinheimera sp. UJ63]
MALKRIMHVEDDESIRAVAEIALVDVAGFELLSCDSGASAVAQASDFSPELILLDVMMPQMDGMQTLAALRAIPELANVPVVFMTAKIQQAEKQHYLDAGAIAVIDKPFEPMALGDRLQQLFEQTQMSH